MPTEQLELLLKVHEEVKARSRHEGQRAERALTAMTFLTIAASTVFAATIDNATYRQLASEFVKLSYGLFIAFIILVAAGTFLTIWGIFPRFTSRGLGVTLSAPTGQVAHSIFYAPEIAVQPRESWIKFWNEAKPEALDLVAFAHLTKETHLIAESTVYTMRRTRWAFWLFLSALIPLIGMFLMVALSAIY
jgi:hypothetical protein